MARHGQMTDVGKQQLALHLLRQGGKLKDIAAQIGVTRATLANWLVVYERDHGKVARRGKGNKDQAVRDDATGERCRCGLRLPCDDCIPSIYEYATARKDAA